MIVIVAFINSLLYLQLVATVVTKLANWVAPLYPVRHSRPNPLDLTRRTARRVSLQTKKHCLDGVVHDANFTTIRSPLSPKAPCCTSWPQQGAPCNPKDSKMTLQARDGKQREWSSITVRPCPCGPLSGAPELSSRARVSAKPIILHEKCTDFLHEAVMVHCSLQGHSFVSSVRSHTKYS